MNSNNLNTLWNEFLNKVEKRVMPYAFEAWFKDTKLIELTDHVAKVLVQSKAYKKHIEMSFDNLIKEVFTDVTGSNFEFQYLTNEELENNISIDSNSFGVPNDAIFETNLNPDYTFDNFVSGSKNNSYAYAKAIAYSVAEKPGQMYNPLYIYGPSGLGKTHLMHAIGNYIVENSNKRVLYATSDNFVTDFMELYKKKKDSNDVDFNDNVALFKKKYRDVDVLIIDDIQYLEVVGGIQQEFFNTINELHDHKKQMILASDRSPDDLKKLEDRIRTRFSWGILVNMYPPDFDVRMEIIDKKIENFGINITYPQDVKEYIATNCTSNVRILEGAIKRVFAYATIMGGMDLTLDLAKEALKDIFTSSIIVKNKIDLLQQIICETYNISMEDLKGKKRNSNIALARQIGMYIARVNINESYPKIGSDFGGKDHSTVMHSVRKIEKAVKNDPKIKTEVDKIISKLNVEKR